MPAAPIAITVKASSPRVFSFQKGSTGDTVTTLNGTPLTDAEVPSILSKAVVVTTDGDRVMDIICDKTRIIARIHPQNPKDTFTYVELDAKLNTPINIDLNSPLKREIDDELASYYRLHDKLECLHSPTLTQQLANVLPQNYADLYWRDIKHINDQLMYLAYGNPDEQDKAQNALTDFIQDKQNQHLPPTTARVDLSTLKAKIVEETKQFSELVKKLNNHYLIEIFKDNDFIPNPQQITSLNQLFESAYAGSKAERAIVSNLNQFSLYLKNTLGITVDLTPAEFALIQQGYSDFQLFEQIRNPILSYVLNMYAPRLKKDCYDGNTTRARIMDVIKKLNDPIHGTGETISAAWLEQLLPDLTQETPGDRTRALFTEPTSDSKSSTTAQYNVLYAINAYQHNLYVIDEHIAPNFPELAGIIEDILKIQTLKNLDPSQVDEPKLHLNLGAESDVKKVIEAIKYDMAQGANLYEALNIERLDMLVNGECAFAYDVALPDSEKQKIEAAQYQELIGQYHQKLHQLRDGFAGPTTNNQTYLNMYDTHGNLLALRVTPSTSADTTTADPLVIIESPPLDNPHSPALDLLAPQLATIDTPPIRAFNADKLKGQAYWSEETNQWYQWHWCPRTGYLGRIDVNGDKAVYVNKKNQWEKGDDALIKAMSWPSTTVTFPTRKPLAFRGFPQVEPEAQLKDKDDLDEILHDAELKIAEHLKTYQPETLKEQLKTIQATLPFAHAAYISRQQRARLEEVTRIVPEVERLITRQRQELIEIQERFAAILADSLPNTKLHQDRTTAQTQKIHDIYHAAYEQRINQYTNLLRVCHKIRSHADGLLTKAKLGVKSSLVTPTPHVGVEFGEESDKAKYIDNEPTSSATDKTHTIQTSTECQVQVTTNAYRTSVEFPTTAQEKDLIDGFQHGTEFSHGQLPIQINFNTKSAEAKKAAEVLRDQALMYLKNEGLDPKSYLYINGTAYNNQGQLDKVTEKYLSEARLTWLEKSPTAQQQTMLKGALDGLAERVQKFAPQSATPSPSVASAA